LRPLILIVDDDKEFREDLSTVLDDEFESIETDNGDEALKLLQEHSPNAILLDLVLGTEKSGLDILDDILKRVKHLPVIMLTEHASIDTAVDAMRKGAYSYISKNTGTDELKVLIKKGILEKRLHDQAKALREEINQDYYHIVGESPPIKALQEKIKLFASNLQTVLIQGESGTGKELVARQIHLKSDRKNRPFVAVNCAAIPKDLLESELFGHEAGAFTGATKRKLGKLEVAGDGIIFFDEIGELDQTAQSKLLRFLEEKEFERVGGTKTISSNVKVIAATNRNLLDRIQSGHFREDLFYRLEMLSIHVPSLKERISDIPLLVEHFLLKTCYEIKSKPKYFNEKSIDICNSYPWPGNVRELRNAVSSSAIISTGIEIFPKHLPPRLSGSQILTEETQKIASSWEEMNEMRIEAEEKAARDIERPFLKKLLEKFDGNVAQAAKEVGINRSNLYRMMKRCEII
jgi:DNA-binding NtrC family response regulator